MPEVGPLMASSKTEELASRAADFDAVARVESQRLFGLALTILRDRAEAEDAVQESLIRAWRRWDDLRDSGARRAWLTRVCVNQCLNSRARLLRRLFAPLPETASNPRDEHTLGLEHGGALATLTRDQRAVIALHFGHGYTLDECADILGCASGTVRSRLGRALKVMRKEMIDD